MPDPRLANAPIMLRTGCHVGTHVFIWTGNSWRNEPDDHVRCACGAYTWGDWQEAQRGERPEEA